MKNLKSNIIFIIAVLIAITVATEGIRFIDNIYTLELSNLDNATKQHIEFISNLD